MTRVLFDTNVLLDAALVRLPFHATAAAAIDVVERRQVEGLVAGHAVTTIAYMLQREHDTGYARQALAHLLARFTVAPVTDGAVRLALATSMRDFEDAVTAMVANEARVDLIVTRDATGFANSPVTAVRPEAFLAGL